MQREEGDEATNDCEARILYRTVHSKKDATMTLPTQELDDLDQEIIWELQEDARRPYKKIAAKLSVAESTVSNRVNRLLESGLLKLEARVDPFKLSHKVAALVGIHLDRQQQMSVIHEIQGLPGVNAVWVSTGKYDLFAEVMRDSITDLNTFIFNNSLGRLEKIKSTESFIMLYSNSKHFKMPKKKQEG